MSIDTVIAQGNVGTVGSYEVEFKAGKLNVTGVINESPVAVNVALSLDAGAVLDALARAIPGTIDDSIIAVIKAALIGS